MILIKGKVILRSLRTSDIDKINILRHETEIRKNALFHPFPISDIADELWLKNILEDKSNRNIYFGLEVLDPKELIGYLSLTNIDWVSRNCEFGIVIGRTFQGKGYGQSAIDLILRYAFSTLQLYKVSLKVLNTNVVATHIYEKAGFIKEGLLKDQYYWDNHFQDVQIMSVFKD